MISPNSREPLDIRVDDNLEACSIWWQRLEAGAMASPYQRYALTRAWWKHCEKQNHGHLQVVGVFHEGAPFAVMPLVIERSLGMRVALPVGARHFNWQFPLWDSMRAAQFGPDAIYRLMRRIGAAIDADAIVYPNMPAKWGGRENPFLAAGATESPSATYHLGLHPDFEALAQARRSAKALKQIRRKRIQLEKSAGPVSLQRAQNADDIGRVLDAAMIQRAARKRSCGIPNIFDRPGTAAFMRELLEESCSFSMRDAPLSAYALFAGEHIVATYFGTSLNGSFSCFINSFDDAFGSFSPGDIALHDVIARACAEGLTGLDLGVGDERYKQAWCERVPLFESSAPITLRGRIYEQAMRMSRGSKRAIKQNQTLWGSWRAVRRVTARAFA